MVQNIADNDYHHDEDNWGPIVKADLYMTTHYISKFGEDEIRSRIRRQLIDLVHIRFG